VSVKKETILLGERISELINALKVQDRDFAASIGIDQSQFSKIKNNKLPITLKQIMEIISIYNVRAGWLLDSEGSMFKEKSGAFQQPDIQLLTQMKTQIKTLYDLSLQLSVPEKKPDLKEESSDQALTYVATVTDKNQKSGKR
jgi:transcriptional regulator with XRE-family HTH domain